MVAYIIAHRPVYTHNILFVRLPREFYMQAASVHRLITASKKPIWRVERMPMQGLDPSRRCSSKSHIYLVATVGNREVAVSKAKIATDSRQMPDVG
jgi:hypothetical protein